MVHWRRFDHHVTLSAVQSANGIILALSLLVCEALAEPQGSPAQWATSPNSGVGWPRHECRIGQSSRVMGGSFFPFSRVILTEFQQDLVRDYKQDAVELLIM